MIKRILTSALAALAISATLANSLAATTTAANIHAMDAYVDGIGVEYITFKTADGNGWAIYYEDDWTGGEKLVLVHGHTEHLR